MHTFHALLGAALLSCVSPVIASDPWSVDFEAAKKQAAASNQDVLMFFTGSDWCGPCKILTQEVFATDAFLAGVKGKFVLVELDFPKDTSKQSPETIQQNQKLYEDYKVDGYPHVILADAEGLPYAITGYVQGGPEVYLSHLDQFRARRVARDEAFAAARKLEGVAKAKLLIKGLQALAFDLFKLERFYGSVVKEIKASDPNDATGFGKMLTQVAKLEAFASKLNELGNAKRFADAIQLCDDTLAAGEMTGRHAQRIMGIKAVLLVETDSLDEALVQVDKAIDFAPDSSEGDPLREFKKKIVTLIEKRDAKNRRAQDEAAKEQPQEAPAAKPNAAVPLTDQSAPVSIDDAN